MSKSFSSVSSKSSKSKCQPLSHVKCEFSNICDVIESLPMFSSRFEIVKKLKFCKKRAVYHVIDRNDNCHAVVKFIIKHNMRKRNLALLHFIKNCNHPNIYTIYEVGTAGAFNIVISKYIEGKVLNKYLKESSKKAINDVLKGILTGLKYLHDRNIQHVDIKPSNIIVASDGTPKIIDFDLSKLVKDEYVQDDLIMGTFPYIPKEIFSDKKFYLKSDVWSLGVSLIKIFYHENLNIKNTNKVDDLSNTITNDNILETLTKSTVTLIHDYNKNNCEFYEEYSRFNFCIFKKRLGKKLCKIIQAMVTIDVDIRPTVDDVLAMMES